MKRLSSSGLDDLNLGASLELGGIIRFSGITFDVFSADDPEGRIISSGCVIEGDILGVVVAAFNNCFSASWIFFCLKRFASFEFERPLSKPDAF